MSPGGALYAPLKGGPEMNELLRLLNEFEADETLIGLVETAAQEPAVTDTGEPDPDADPVGLAAMSDDDLDALITGLRALATDEEASAALLGEAADAVAAANAEVQSREEAAEAEEAERQDAIARLNGEDDGEDTEDGDDEDVEVEAEADTDEDADGDVEGEGEEAAEAEAEPVLAADANRHARRAARRQARRRATAHQPRSTAAVENRDNGDLPAFTYLADSGRTAGSTAPDLVDVDQALANKAAQFGRVRANSARGVEAHIPVAQVQRQYPEERRLVDGSGRMLPPDAAQERISAAINTALGNYRTEGLPAAGGLCAPLQPIYTVMQLGEQRRPIRDTALVTFQAARGGVVSVTPPGLPQIAAQDPNSVGIWTMQDDVDALDPPPEGPRKTVARVECGEPVETEIRAVTHQLIIGNILARTFPEYVGSWSALTLVHQDRVAETAMFQDIVNSDITVQHSTTSPQVSGIKDVLATLDFVAATIRSQHRLLDNFPFRAILPESLLKLAVTDLMRSLPGASVLELMRLASNEIMSFFPPRQINVTWSPDTLILPPVTDGNPLPDWPTAVPYAIYPEGSFLGLDSGELDLGIVRDNELNKANDHETFAETFEAVHPIGVPGTVVAGEIAVCPSGAAAGTVEPLTCGS